MPLRPRLLLVAAALAVPAALAGCADDPAPSGAATTAPGPASPAAGAMLPVDELPSVGEIPADSGDLPVAVRGHLVVTDGTARLCDGLRESHPPQCAEPSLRVLELPDEMVAGLEEAGGVRWSEAPVMLLGRVRDGAITVDPTVLAAS